MDALDLRGRRAARCFRTITTSFPHSTNVIPAQAGVQCDVLGLRSHGGSGTGSPPARGWRCGEAASSPRCDSRNLSRLSPRLNSRAYSLHPVRKDGCATNVACGTAGSGGVSTRTVGPWARDEPGMPSPDERGWSREPDPRTCPSEVPASRGVKRLILINQRRQRLGTRPPSQPEAEWPAGASARAAADKP